MISMHVLRFGLMLFSATVSEGSERELGFPFGLGASLLLNASLAEELKLNSSQKDLFRVLGVGIRAEQQGYAATVLSERHERASAKLQMNESSKEKEIFAILDGKLRGDQLIRLKQVWIQAKGIEAFFDGKSCTRLALTAEQTQRIRRIALEPVHLPRTETSLQSPFDTRDVEPTKALRLKAALAILNERQRHEWGALVGDVFRLKPNPPNAEMRGEPLPVPPAPVPARPNDG